MIAEVLLLLAGHSSSLFSEKDNTLNPVFIPLLHPGEAQCLESLGLIAFRYRKIKQSCASLATSPSQYICTLSSSLQRFLRDGYESLVIDTEARVLHRDPKLVAGGSFVPLSAIRATFEEWEAPLASFQSLMEEVDSRESWPPGPLIDMLQGRARTGVHRIASVFSELSRDVQRVWRTHAIAFMIHGEIELSGLLTTDYKLLDGSTPTCVSPQTRDSMSYIGRAIGTVKAAKWHQQLPRRLALEYTSVLEGALPEDSYSFGRAIGTIRTGISEWLWDNVLTRKDVDDALDSMANYFLLRNGEFALSLIRELEQLKLSRLTSRAGSSTIIREQDIHLAMLRASLGTSAQQDSAVASLRFHLPSGPAQPSLTYDRTLTSSIISTEAVSFNDILLGTPVILSYVVTWPLDLFLQPADIQVYSSIFSYISAVRRTHTRIHLCWSWLSNAQRARRRWTGLNEGGSPEDVDVRRNLLRCSWGIVRKMCFFLDVILGHVMQDVCDDEYRRLKARLNPHNSPSSINLAPPAATHRTTRRPSSSLLEHSEQTGNSTTARLDFTSVREMHGFYLKHLLEGCLLTNQALSSIIRQILDLCERFVAQVERWGGDVLPALLFEGSLNDRGSGETGDMVRERFDLVLQMDSILQALFTSFYDQLSLSTSKQFNNAAPDVSRSVLPNVSMADATTSFGTTFVRSIDGDGASRRHVESLLLRLDFNSGFSKTELHPASERP
ncbi:hypothetical protein PUNSTDRAFT_58137 [Punctularia strigosozonata HHB-11173 SS5]|uniref:uncharacterized protein n=1 Tax=Punctularia strigosozonata (strain HHB-11173) TaxID=741275 RepID=UPI0004417CC4|nr:uncharacterized protein PUNSTDRAFT_58137 [Punctularia strigosozonata HHB-11173 SS5]EIN13937.1 hypothetical protein PUNSTDRAFT_58137 [Punctularia strigosozonata HHB-11173 SS5]